MFLWQIEMLCSGGRAEEPILVVSILPGRNLVVSLSFPHPGLNEDL